jgi:periplasmic protein TonB
MSPVTATLDIVRGPALGVEEPTGARLTGGDRTTLPFAPLPLRRRSLFLAALLHVLVPLSLLLPGLLSFHHPDEPPPLQVSLVLEKPPPPPPPPVPARKPPEKQQRPPPENPFRSSGPDKTTSTGEGIADPTASPDAISQKSAADAAPETRPEPPKPAPVEAPPEPEPAPPPAPPQPAAQAPPPPAEDAVAVGGKQQVVLPEQKPAPPKPDPAPPAPAKTETAALTPPTPHRLERGGVARSTPRSLAPNGPITSGDAYLNAVKDLISSHETYPPQARALDLVGIAIYEIIIDRTGRVLSVRVTESSGSTLLDKTGADAIWRSNPLPPVPSDILGEKIGLIFKMPIAP